MGVWQPRSGSARLNIVSQPQSVSVLVNFSGGERNRLLDTGIVSRLEQQVIDGQEQFAGNECCSLVPIGEGMVADDSGRVERGKPAKVFLTICKSILGTCERTIQKCRVPEPRQSAMLGDLFIMYRKNHL